MLVNLYDNLGNATPNGTWTYLGSAPNPPIPDPYNANIDLTNVPYGSYTYQYFVDCETNSHTNVITLDYYEQTPVSNDECTGAIGLPLNGNQLINQTTLTECPGNLVSLSSETNNFSNIATDVWYKSNTLNQSNFIQIEIQPTGLIPIGNNQNNSVYLSIYSSTCGSLVLEEEGAMILNAQNNYIYYSTKVFSQEVLYYRVYSVQNTEGYFNINISFDDP